MKTKILLGALLLAMFVAFTACRKHHDKDPEIVDDPMKTVTEYYIAGVVTENNVPLSGVSIKTGTLTTTSDADGKYKLTVGKADTYTLSFAKSGYLNIDNAEVTIANNAANRSSVALSVKMSKESPKVEIQPDEPVIITDKGSGQQQEAATALNIPTGAVDVPVEVSVTPYHEPAPVSTSVSSGTSTGTAAITNIVITSTEEVTLKAPVTLSVTNKASENVYFDEVEVYSKPQTKASGDWVKETDATFNPTTNSYDFTVAKGKKLAGEYSVRVKNTKTTGQQQTGEDNIDPVKVSNAGNMEAIKDYKIAFDAWTGWNYSVTPENALSAVSSNTTDIKGMAAMIEAAIEAEEGVKGTYKIPYSLTTNISGNYILYYTNKARFCEKTYVFKIKKTSVTVKLKCYTGMVENYINADATQHSGGNFKE